MTGNATGRPGEEEERAVPNRLVHESSPYLLQHAFNPVAWYPWGDEAFGEAKRRDCPIFLSIGYSTCHWCHVMAHESFEDARVASLMNDSFICIKVDREERPDIDELYMSVAIVLTGSGGWPLTIIMTPEKKPFFAATYLPKEDRFGMRGLVTLIPEIMHLWQEARGRLTDTADHVTGSVGTTVPGLSADAGITGRLLHEGYAALRIRFDHINGGFGGAPKFPSPHMISFLLRYGKRTRKTDALAMAEKTLEAMSMGGIYDHLGSGFHRYSTDARWLVPHFEKMLYDQALLVIAYTEAYQMTKRPWYRTVAMECLAYLVRDLQSASGGFFSAVDADSEGSEGKFYLWSADELEEVLGDDAHHFARAYNVSGKGNFREQGDASPSGKNILYRSESLKNLAKSAGMQESEYAEYLAGLRMKLLRRRETRVKPAIDDKILTDWNGLVISAFSLASVAFSDERYLTTARKTSDFLLRTTAGRNGELMHRFRNGKAGIEGLGSDYAFLTGGLLDLFEASQEARYLGAALDIQSWFSSHFEDTGRGGFFTSGDKAADLIVRKKDIYDGALPSVNSVAFKNLVRFGLFTADPRYHERAWQLARWFAPTVEQSPESYTGFLSALDFALGPAYGVVIAGVRNDPKTREMQNAIGKRFIPSKVVIYRPIGEDTSSIDTLTGFTGNFSPVQGRSAAWVCSNHSCGIPTDEIAVLMRNLGESPE